MKVKGFVKDKQKNPLENVNIYIKDKKYIGTTTSSTGYFELVVEAGSTIVFSHLGFREQHAQANEHYPLLNIILNEEVEQLEGTTVVSPRPQNPTNNAPNKGEKVTITTNYNDQANKSKTLLYASGFLLLLLLGYGIYTLSTQKKEVKKVKI